MLQPFCGYCRNLFCSSSIQAISLVSSIHLSSLPRCLYATQSQRREEEAAGWSQDCTRSWRGRILPARPEKFLGDYTSLSRSEIISMWSKGHISINGRSGGKYGEEQENGSRELQQGECSDEAEAGRKNEVQCGAEVDGEKRNDIQHKWSVEKRVGDGGRFMSDYLVMEDDIVRVHQHAIHPSCVPLQPHLGLSLSEEESSLFLKGGGPVLLIFE